MKHIDAKEEFDIAYINEKIKIATPSLHDINDPEAWVRDIRGIDE